MSKWTRRLSGRNRLESKGGRPATHPGHQAEKSCGLVHKVLQTWRIACSQNCQQNDLNVMAELFCGCHVRLILTLSGLDIFFFCFFVLHDETEECGFNIGAAQEQEKKSKMKHL
ncbi:hypothetical protein PoB_005562100 [Plakobranchus ocellatus]|uniref:Uncharacterized protein n=1 Tax=Plakobranchus ocellatus TaxID=259542 RepID=A0AAV4CCP2_9GAST|nr:hypothetical protein PoB_005562100 [Plakobranchus ocellatus]